MSRHYVLNPSRSRPTKSHPNKDCAKAEANRLAHQHKGDTFHVLKLEASFCEQARPTFGSLCVGEKFKNGGRTLMKTDNIVHEDSYGHRQTFNAGRLAPGNVAGWYSQFSDSTYIEMYND